MSLARQPFDWTGPDDEPVFLDAAPWEGLSREDGKGVLVEAEHVSRHAQEAIGRQDTDPSATRPPLRAEPRSGLVVSSLSRPKLVLLLSVSCGLAFAHGWMTGASARADSAPDPVMRATVSPTTAVTNGGRSSTP